MPKTSVDGKLKPKPKHLSRKSVVTLTLNFKLTPACRPPEWPRDDMGRAEIGFSPNDTDQQLYEKNRGVWLLGGRAHREQYATFSYDHAVCVVIEIDGIEDIPRRAGGKPRQAIIGRVLSAGHPAYDALYRTDVDHHRNPVTYLDDPVSAPPGCACGCGTSVTGDRLWASGHDQRAVHERITRRWGSALGFVRWFDATFPASDPGRATPDSSDPDAV